MLEQPAQRRGDLGGITGIHQQACSLVAHDPLPDREARHDDREARGHVLERLVADRFDLFGPRQEGAHPDPRPRYLSHHLLVRAAPEPAHPVPSRRTLEPLPEPGVGAREVAEQDQARL